MPVSSAAFNPAYMMYPYGQMPQGGFPGYPMMPAYPQYPGFGPPPTSMPYPDVAAAAYQASAYNAYLQQCLLKR